MRYTRGVLSNRVLVYRRLMKAVVMLIALACASFVVEAQSTEDLELLSVRDTGNQAANGASSFPQSSADGGVVVFTSAASDLVPNDTNGAMDVFVRDLRQNTTTLVSVNGAGTAAGNALSFDAFITPDGHHVVFVSEAGDLVANDTNGKKDVFVRDLRLQQTTIVSVNLTGAHSGDDDSFGGRITPDGRYVVFTSHAENLVGNNGKLIFPDVFLRDLVANTTVLISINRVSTASGNGPSSGNQGGYFFPESGLPAALSITPDGRYVLFMSAAKDLVDLDTTPAVQNSFRRDVHTNTTALVTINSAGSASSNSLPITAWMSDDGQVVVFESHATDLVPNGNIGPDTSIYARDFTNNTTTLISQRGIPGVLGVGRSTSPLITSDGRYIYFLRPDSLFMVFGAQDPERDKIFRRDRLTGSLVQMPKINSGACNQIIDCRSQITNLTISGDGRYLAYRQIEYKPAPPPMTSAVVLLDVASGGFAVVGGFSGSHNGNVDLLKTIPGNIVAGPKLAMSSTVSHSSKDLNSTEDVYLFAPQERSSLSFENPPAFVREDGAIGFLVRRTGFFPNAIATVDFTTSDGTAMAGSDYHAVSGTLTFEPGETFKLIGVPFINDSFVEPDETLQLTLSNVTGTGTTLGTPSSTLLTIVNDDQYTLNFEGRFASASETSGHVNVTVTLAGGTPHPPVSVYYVSGGGTASDRSDYTSQFGRILRFAPNENSRTITFLLTDDTYLENPETFYVDLVSPSGGATIGGFSEMMITITSDDLTDGPNPVRDVSFDASFFVRQHYLDFLNREPDAAGLAFWTNQLMECEERPATERQRCREMRRINVSAAFFLSIEFQKTGYLVYLAHQAAFNQGEQLQLNDTFLRALQEIGQGIIFGDPGASELLEHNLQAFFDDFVNGNVFRSIYLPSMTAEQFVDALNLNTGTSLSQTERDALVGDLASGAKSRAQVLRSICEDADFHAREFNRAFVLMQYFGYLRRVPNLPPDANFDGYNFWLAKLNQFGGDFQRAEMVKAFLNSEEYIRRFGP